MKRILTFALPILATFVVFGIGLFLVRTQTVAIKARFGTVRGAVTELVDEVADEIKEATA
jgi:hypothetical protein